MSGMVSCANGHQLAEGDKFCGDCGSHSLKNVLFPCGKCGAKPGRLTNYCTNCGVAYVPLQSMRASSSSLTSRSFGRNHDVIKSAVAQRVGEVLKTSEIMALVLTFDPHFNPGSLLPNDHAGGNRGACGCSQFKAGPEAEPIFERISSGRYLVLGGLDPSITKGETLAERIQKVRPSFDELFHVDGRNEKEYVYVAVNGLRASEWLRSESAQAIDQVLGRYATTVLSGTKGGRYVAVGVRLPTIPGLEDCSPYWAIGLDTRWDFVLGQRPTQKALYFGVRCNRNVSGVIGDTANQVLAPLLGGRWEKPEQFWAIWKSLSEVDTSGAPLTPEEFIKNLLQQFEEGYVAITSHFVHGQ